ncbi:MULTISPECIES: family 10 glycosylhydrolase [unclassified Nodularia (in: cyanobacteria)]|uniref:family 10 glycosylhydrolase n=1 Tax=unclassified Nodularia (in: cyanobacteria) TaxID=2656917 RepID=UPI00187FF7F3|nr:MULTISPECIES: family 10 glycosylhydrolase [unclassified Nodularia (in: cyanobacteria)]MBE9197926.1 family 10 glycosylhydrolase [Nodularia sp. LEGE 06071]MCC2693543.1 family 10 glycosylhydrolase [Nodularia sp. LEGE 04288]
MSPEKKEPKGCGCANIPISVILLFLGFGWWILSQKSNRDMISNSFTNLLSQHQQIAIPILNPTPTPNLTPTFTPTPTPNLTPTLTPTPTPDITPTLTPTPTPTNTVNPDSNKKPTLPPKTPEQKTSLAQNPWKKKAIRGIYFSRYYITNNANEQTIRQRVRQYRSQGFNTIIHGVWGNGCTMYNSDVMQQKLGFKSCPNKFQDQWLDWLIDEAHKQDMEVHAYFEKGIKIDKNSPIFDLAIARRWVVPGVDRTYSNIEHYVLDVEIPEVANFFKNISVEFVTKYPQIDAVQWDDYLGYHAELPGQVDRTANLTKFVQEMVSGIKQANPKVSFDISHHNPYWAKRYFAADWLNWNIDRVFIQVYNDDNFQEELKYVRSVDGIGISDNQFHRLEAIINNPQIKSVLVFPIDGQPEKTATKLQNLVESITQKP